MSVVGGQVWFDNLSNDLNIVASKLIGWLNQIIFDNKHPNESIPEELLNDTKPRIAFISVSDGVSKSQITCGIGFGISNAFIDAHTKLSILLDKDFTAKWVKVEYVQNSTPLGTQTFKQPLSDEMTLLRKHAPALLQNFKKINDGKRNKLYQFTTRSIFTDNKHFFPLYRGHRIYDDVEKIDLLDRAKQAGDYLIRAVHANGKFLYSYLPKRDKKAPKYNILRHAGTIYSMLELYEVTQNDKLLDAAKKSFEYLNNKTQELKIAGESVLCVTEKGHTKLGGNALAILAYAKLMSVTKEKLALEHTHKLAQWIEKTQDSHGRFTIHKQKLDDLSTDQFVSNYYPGEAIFALTRLYKLDGQQRWLNIAEKAANYIINVRDKNKSIENLDHDHWLLYGLNELHLMNPKQMYVEHTQKISQAIINAQCLKSENADWIGSYYKPPRSTPTAIRMEGMCAAYHLAKRSGQYDYANKILETIKRGIAFQLQTQHQPESVMYLPNPQKALGGFKQSLTNYETRIDYVQHNISSILALYKIVNER